MTVANNIARNQYVATNGQTVFTYAFEISAAANISVWQRSGSAAPDDAADLLTYITDYTLTGIGTTNGGTVVLVSGATTGDIVTMESSVPAERDTSFTPSGVIQAQDLNIEFDNQTLIEQKTTTISDKRTPKYPASAIIGNKDLILSILGAGQFWVMNDNNDEIVSETAISLEDLASHSVGEGASLIGLQDQSNVSNKTVQDLANAAFIVKTNNGSLQNAQALGNLTTGILKNTTSTGLLSISVPLSSIDALTLVADKMLYSTSSTTYATTDLTAFARTLLDDADASSARTTLGLVIGTNVQAYNATLQSLSALGTAADKYAYTTGVNTWAEGAITSYSRSLLAEVDAAAWRTLLDVGAADDALLKVNNLSDLDDTTTARFNLGVEIGVDVQAYDATLQSLSALGTMADKIAYTTGVNTWAETAFTSLARDLLADATQADAAATLSVLPLSGGTLTGNLILNGPATLSNQAVTLSQLQGVILNEQLACEVATTTDMPTWTYNNGTLGVGATLTAPSNGASTFDGVIPTNGQRILVLFQTTNPAWQGAYTIVQGTGGTPTVLTRATDWDQAAEMNPGDIFSVVVGTTYGASQWMFAQTAAITVGTTALTFTQLAGQGSLLKANNLSDLPSVATARSNLGLVIGTNVQAYDATLQSLSGLGTAADRIAYTTGVDTWAEANITAFGRSLIAAVDAAAARTVLALGTIATQNANNVTITGGSITGITDLALADGGTNASLVASNGGIVYSTATALAILAGTATANQILISGSSAAPAWSTTTYPATSVTNSILYATSTNVIGQLAPVNSSFMTSSAGGVPTWSTATETRAALGLSNAAANIIIGGNFDTNPWQRGTTFTSATSQYTADRMSWLLNGAGVVDIKKTADSPTISQANFYCVNCYHVDVTTVDASISATDFYTTQYNSEGYDIAGAGFGQSNAKQITLSFWHKHTKTGTYTVGFQNSAADRSYVVEYTQAVSNTWEYTSMTITGDTTGTWLYTNGAGLRIYFNIAMGSNYNTTAGAWQAGNVLSTTNQVNGMDNTANDFKLALIKLELGSVATTYPLESGAQILSRCQRYYQKTFAQGSTPAQNFGRSGAFEFLQTRATGASSISPKRLLPVVMRTTPSVTTYNPSATNAQVRNLDTGVDCSAITIDNINDCTIGFNFTLDGGAAITNLLSVHYTLNAEL